MALLRGGKRSILVFKKCDFKDVDSSDAAMTTDDFDDYVILLISHI